MIGYYAWNCNYRILASKIYKNIVFEAPRNMACTCRSRSSERSGLLYDTYWCCQKADVPLNNEVNKTDSGGTGSWINMICYHIHSTLKSLLKLSLDSPLRLFAQFNPLPESRERERGCQRAHRCEPYFALHCECQNETVILAPDMETSEQ